jgi:hypothetical protein
MIIIIQHESRLNVFGSEAGSWSSEEQGLLELNAM